MKTTRRLLFLALAISLCMFAFACAESDVDNTEKKADFGFKLSGDGTIIITNCYTTDSKLVIPSTISNTPVSEIADGAFFNYSAATEIVIEEGVKYIGKSAFEHCTSLKKVTLPSSLERLGEKAFNDCAKLEDVIIQSNSALYYIGINAFSGCRALHSEKHSGSIYLPIGNSKFALLLSAESQSVSSVEIHPETEIIAGSAFYQCASLTEITIPENVRHIGDKAFYGCTNLEKIYFNARNMNDLALGSALFEKVATKSDTMTLFIGSSVKRIPAHRMDSASRLRVVRFDDNSICESIGTYAFAGTPLPDFTIPKSIKSIEPYAFANCNWLSLIKLDAENLNNLTSESNIFYEAGTKTSGVTLTVGRDTKRIPAYFCDSFKSLVHVNFENNDVTKSFGEYAFNDCSGILRVSLTSRTGWCESKFENEYSNPICYGNATIMINNSPVTAGIILLSDTTTISDYAFVNYSYLTQILIPNSVTVIGKSAFQGASNLNLIYWEGTEGEWKNLAVKEGNDIISKSTVYYYSKNAPTTPGNYWYYAKDDLGNEIPAHWRNTTVSE